MSPYLERNRIPRDLPDQPYAPLPKRQRIWAFLEDVETSEGIETLGFLMGDHLDLAHTGPFGLRLMQAATLFDALRFARRALRDVAQGNSLRIQRQGDSAWIGIESYRRTCRPADHAMLKFLIEIVRLAAGPEWNPSVASLQTGRVRAIEALPCFKRTSFRYNASEAGLLISASLLSRPLHEDENCWSTPFDDLIPLPRSGRLSDSLRVVIATLLPHYGPPSVNEAAEMSGMSRATLFRRLAEEGVTYRELVERVRYQAAQSLLRNPALAIKDISSLLGYSVPNNFIRAFRNVAGTTPSSFRREHAGI